MTTTIPRTKFTQFDGSMDQARQELATAAKDSLGYNKLAQVITIPDALMYGLRELDIEPFARSGVEAYKAKKAKPGMWSGHVQGLWSVSVTLALAGIAAWINHFTNWDNPSLNGFGVMIVTALSCVVAIIALNCFYNDNWRGERITRHWHMVSLSGFDGTVPEFVLDRALLIKCKVPSAEFYIDQLFLDVEHTRIPDRDPFLVVRLKDETYWIDVWDEKEYEATL